MTRFNITISDDPETFPIHPCTVRLFDGETELGAGYGASVPAALRGLAEDFEHRGVLRLPGVTA